MSELLQHLGLGVGVAYGALPLLLATVRAREGRPAVRQRALATVLLLDVALISLPFLRAALWAAWARHLPELPAPTGAATDPLTTVAVSTVSRVTVTPLQALGGLWVLGVAFSLARAALGAWRLARLRRRGSTPAAEVLSEVDRLARELGLRPPYVVESTEVSLPFVAGLLRPTLILPVRLLSSLDPEGRELALRHELVHLQRLDHWWAAGMLALRLGVPFHPFATVLQRRYALAREEAVDALVAPRSPLLYARLLVDAATFTTFGMEERVAMSGTDLAQRVKRLTDGAGQGGARGALPIVLFAAVGAVLLAAPRVAAETPVANDDDASPSRTVRLQLGQVTELPVADPERVAIGDPEIADVRVHGRGLELTGMGEGTTTLLIWHTGGAREAYTIKVGSGIAVRPDTTVTVAPHQQKVLTIPNLTRVAIGDPTIADVSNVGSNQLLVTGVSEGRTTLLVWTGRDRRSYLIHVTAGR